MMSRSLRIALILPPILATVASPGQAADMVTFRVLDQLGVTEVEESTAIYIDQRLIGSFHLDSQVRELSVIVTVPRAESYQYVMCGRVSTRAADGSVVDHEVNTSGVLHDVDGREFEAVTDNFERYYIRDRTSDAPPAPLETNTGRRCAPAVS
jgi:hypothetical protein